MNNIFQKATIFVALFFFLSLFGLIAYQYGRKDVLKENNPSVNIPQSFLPAPTSKPDYASTRYDCLSSSSPHQTISNRQLSADIRLYPSNVESNGVEKKKLSLNIVIKNVLDQPGSSVVVSPSDFSLVDDKGRPGVFLPNDRTSVLTACDYPLPSSPVYLYTGSQVEARIVFLVEKDSKSYQLIYTPSDIKQKATLKILVPKLPIAG